jgi:hypothetical protein
MKCETRNNTGDKLPDNWGRPKFNEKENNMFLTPEALDAQLDALVIDIEHDADYHDLDANEYEEKYLELEDDGQPTEYEEYQDLYGGDDWDHGQYEEVL